jgi:hypothetical protein
VHNVNISGAVGRNGRNLPADVRKVQELLNEHLAVPHRPLDVDGGCGPLTIMAIEDFQRRVVKLARPTGTVKPQDDTMAALSPVALKRAAEVLVPYREGVGLYVKSPGSASLFGTPKTLASIERVARRVAEQLGCSLGITDMSLEGGDPHPGHKSHRRGIDVDIRPLRTDRKSLGVTITDPAYSHELTKTMVGYLREDPNLHSILFNDAKIPGVTSSPGHHDHLHVRFKE